MTIAAPRLLALTCIVLLAAPSFAHKKHGEPTGPSGAEAETGSGSGSGGGSRSGSGGTNAKGEDNASARTAADDDWGDVETVAPTAVTPIASVKPQGIKAIIGYFHAAATHMPIGFVFLLFALDVLCFYGRQRELYRAGYIAMFLTLAAFVPAIVTGLVRFDSLNLTGNDAAQALEHRNFMFAATATMVVAVMTRLPAKAELVGIRRYLYIGFLAVTGVLLTLGGAEGGEMVYGDVPGL